MTDLDRLIRRQRARTFEADLGDGLTVTMRPAVGRDLAILRGGALALRVGSQGEAPALVPDPQAVARVLQRLIIGWDGMTPALAERFLGVEVPADAQILSTDVNIRAMVSESDEFRGLIVRALLDQADEDARRREERLKN